MPKMEKYTVPDSLKEKALPCPFHKELTELDFFVESFQFRDCEPSYSGFVYCEECENRISEVGSTPEEAMERAVESWNVRYEG